jgi:hypothetical protein
MGISHFLQDSYRMSHFYGMLHHFLTTCFKGNSKDFNISNFLNTFVTREGFVEIFIENILMSHGTKDWTS